MERLVHSNGECMSLILYVSLQLHLTYLGFSILILKDFLNLFSHCISNRNHINIFNLRIHLLKCIKTKYLDLKDVLIINRFYPLFIKLFAILLKMKKIIMKAEWQGNLRFWKIHSFFSFLKSADLAHLFK